MPGPGAVPSPAEVARAYMRSRERPIRAWLDRHETRVYTLSENAVVSEIMRGVAGAVDFGVGATRGVIRNWLAGKGRRLPRVSETPHPADRIPPTESRPLPIVTAVEDAIATLTDGVNVTVGPVETVVNVSGVTSRFNLPQGRIEGQVSYSGDANVTFHGEDGQASVGTNGASVRVNPSDNSSIRMGVTWDGEMSFQTRVSQFHFRSTLSRNRWSARLTFPTSRMPEDVALIGDVFRGAETATREVVARTGQIRDPGEISAAIEELDDQFTAIKRAVTSASNIAAPQPTIRFGIEASGPGLSPDADASRESRVMGIISVSF